MDSPKLVDIIDDVRSKTGARVVVLGEEHDSRASVQYIRDSLEDLRSRGIKTIYLEMASDMQPLLDNALKGDPKAQKELRGKYETWWHYGGTEGAQQRYDLAFEANKAGIKVKAIDMQTHGDHLHRYNSLPNAAGEIEDASGRFAFADAVMAKNIKEMDDGAAAIVLVGRSHTYRYDAHNKTEELATSSDPADPDAPHKNVAYPVYRSEHGGLDTRLNALNIQTTSIDFTGSNGKAFSLEKSNDQQNDFRLIVPREDAPKPPESRAFPIQRNLERLAILYEQAGRQADAEGHSNLSPGLNKMSSSLRDIVKTMENPAFLGKSFNQQTTSLRDSFEAIRQQSLKPYTTATQEISRQTTVPVGSPIHPNDAVAIIGDEALKTALEASLRITELDQSSMEIARFQLMAIDNQVMHYPDAETEKSWKRAPMKLAGDSERITSLNHTSNTTQVDAYDHFSKAPNVNVHWQAAQSSLTLPDAPSSDQNLTKNLAPKPLASP